MSLKVALNKRTAGVYVVSISGSIDSETYAVLEAQVEPLLKSETKIIILDMDGVTYISSLGVAVIFKIKNALEKNNGTLMMTNLAPQIKKVFDVIAALPSMWIFASRQEADAYLDKIQAREIEKNKGES